MSKKPVKSTDPRKRLLIEEFKQYITSMAGRSADKITNVKEDDRFFYCNAFHHLGNRQYELIYSDYFVAKESFINEENPQQVL